jgi:peptide/nickel transport system ATP-binding protein
MAKILDVRDLVVAFAIDGGDLTAVDGVSFDLERGEVLGLVGESGSGKTVTCRAVIRLLPSRRARIVSGSVMLDGEDLTAKSEAEMRKVRGRRIGMIFQNPLTHLNPVMTIGDQIAETIRVHQGLSRKEALGEAVEKLRQVGIPDPKSRLNSYPHEFSGGMRQRAMIAGALACDPAVLIADEPTTALDVTVQAQILRLLLDLRDRSGLSIVLITHDLGIVAQTCDSVAVMYAGRIAERAPKRVLLESPLHPYTRGLTDSQPGGMTPHEPLPSIPGQPPSLRALPSGCRFHPRCELADAPCREILPPLVPVAEHHVSACLRWHELAGGR